MNEGRATVLAKLKKPRFFIPAILLLLILGGGVGYLILLSPGSIFIRWAEAALPNQITKITFGPYPEDSDFQRLKKEHVKYIVSLLDPRLPYEKQLIDRERVKTEKYGMILKVFPMASIFDRQVFPDYEEQQGKAVEFLRHVDGPAYVHCYLGKHRVIHVRDALIRAGVPKRYWEASGNNQEYWDLVNRLDEAQERFNQGEYAKVIEILDPVTAKDVDVTSLRGWSHYRLGLIDEAAEDFRQGLEVDPTNPRNLLGSGYCYLRQSQPVMAQRQFSAILELIPDDPGALTGMGLTYLRLGNRAAAVQLFHKILAKDPDNHEVQEYLQQAEGS